MTIQRGTQYIKFVAARATNANKIGDVMEAWRDYGGWHVHTVECDTVYQTGPDMIRTIAGRCIEQSDTVPNDLSNIWAKHR